MTQTCDNYKRGILVAGASLAALSVCRRGAAASLTALPVEQPAGRADEDFIERALVMRRTAIDGGDQAYGAVVVRDGRIVGQSPSRVVQLDDPTAHAEMEAIRDAARRLGSRDLSGCTLYSTTSACPMCEAAAYWAGIERMVAGVDARDGGAPRLCG